MEWDEKITEEQDRDRRKKEILWGKLKALEALLGDDVAKALLRECLELI
jgi:hypothetical protein